MIDRHEVTPGSPSRSCCGGFSLGGTTQFIVVWFLGAGRVVGVVMVLLSPPLKRRPMPRQAPCPQPVDSASASRGRTSLPLCLSTRPSNAAPQFSCCFALALLVARLGCSSPAPFVVARIFSFSLFRRRSTCDPGRLVVDQTTQPRSRAVALPCPCARPFVPRTRHRNSFVASDSNAPMT